MNIKIVIKLLFVLLVMFSCKKKTATNPSEINIENGYHKTIFQNRLIYMGGDSILSKRTTLFYDNKDELYHKKYEVLATKNENSDDYKTIIDEYYENGNKTSEVRYFVKGDSLILQGKDTIKCNELHIAYDKNGNVKEKGCQGYISNADISTGMSVGTWFYYKNGELIKEVYFHNAEFGKDYIIHRCFNDEEFTDVITNNFILYENDSVPLSPSEIKKREIIDLDLIWEDTGFWGCY
ncbi:hypothetical protein KRX57_04700 [Weeksellaceae bacterium TAE3-ERU29]|nr:hypothetical protein [Weeksellaceae bacterium TAE3-ERU29]